MSWSPPQSELHVCLSRVLYGKLYAKCDSARTVGVKCGDYLHAPNPCTSALIALYLPEYIYMYVLSHPRSGCDTDGAELTDTHIFVRHVESTDLPDLLQQVPHITWARGAHAHPTCAWARLHHQFEPAWSTDIPLPPPEHCACLRFNNDTHTDHIALVLL